MPTVETDMRRAHRTIRKSITDMNAAKADLLGYIREARSQDYTLADIARILGVSRSQAQKYVDQVNDLDGYRARQKAYVKRRKARDEVEVDA